MPRTRAPSICPEPGCPHDTPCQTHPPRPPWAGSNRSSRLPTDWNRRRQLVLKRDHHTCQACAGTRCGNQRLEVDHITRGDNHELTNLQTLGHACHQTKTLEESHTARTGRPTHNRG